MLGKKVKSNGMTMKIISKWISLRVELLLTLHLNGPKPKVISCIVPFLRKAHEEFQYFNEMLRSIHFLHIFQCPDGDCIKSKAKGVQFTCFYFSSLVLVYFTCNTEENFKGYISNAFWGKYSLYPLLSRYLHLNGFIIYNYLQLLLLFHLP